MSSSSFGTSFSNNYRVIVFLKKQEYAAATFVR